MTSEWYSAFFFQMKKMFWADSNDFFFCFIKTKWKPSNFWFCFALSFFFPLQLLCLAALLENAVIHWSESPLVTSLKILLEIHLKHLQSFTSFLRSEHLLIKHCHRAPREKPITRKWMQDLTWPGWRYRDISFPSKEKTWESSSVSSSNYGRLFCVTAEVVCPCKVIKNATTATPG